MFRAAESYAYAVTNVTLLSKTSRSLTYEWLQPSRPRGVITQYISSLYLVTPGVTGTNTLVASTSTAGNTKNLLLFLFIFCLLVFLKSIFSAPQPNFNCIFISDLFAVDVHWRNASLVKVAIHLFNGTPSIKYFAAFLFSSIL